MALYRTRIIVEWTNADGTPGNYAVNHGVHAVSAKHALSKALRKLNTLPCYADREAENIPVRGSVEILEAA